MYTLEDVIAHGIGQLSDSEARFGVEAFNGLAPYLGHKWIERQMLGIRSPFMVLWASDLWRDIQTLSNLDGLEPILKRLTGTHCGAATELHVAAGLVCQGQVVELEPVAGGKKPDLRFRADGRWVYLEITRRDITAAMASTTRILNQLAQTLINTETRGHGMVTVLGTDVAVDVDLVSQWLQSAPSPGDVLGGEAAFDLLADDQGPSVIAERYGEGPWLFATSFQTNPLKRATAAMPVLDDSAGRLISQEAKQLPKNGPSVVCLDIGAFPGGPAQWDGLIRRRLATVHGRIGAVVVYSRLFSLRGVETKGSVITNLRGRIALSEAEVTALRRLSTATMPRNPVIDGG